MRFVALILGACVAVCVVPACDKNGAPRAAAPIPGVCYYNICNGVCCRENERCAYGECRYNGLPHWNEGMPSPFGAAPDAGAPRAR